LSVHTLGIALQCLVYDKQLVCQVSWSGFLNPDFTVNRDVNIAAAMLLTGNAEKAANKKSGT